MSYGAIVTVHEVVKDAIIDKVLGKKTISKVIKAVDDFAEKYMCGLVDLLDAVHENDPNELSYYCDIPDGSEDTFQADYDSVCEALHLASEAFKAKTGLKGLYLVYNDPEDRYDNIDGFAWALPHKAIYRPTPAYAKFMKAYKTETEWSQVVKFG